MALGKIFKSLFGGGSDSAADSGAQSDGSAKGSQSVEATENYQGFLIEAAPIKEAGQYRTAGFISKEVEGNSKRAPFIRADNSTDKSQAVSHSLAKGRQIIDEQGDKLLDREML